MAIFTQESVKANIRVRDGKRVFYLADGDHLTPSASDWLHAQGIRILPAAQAKPAGYHTPDGGFYTEKPEHMTHLRPDVLVRKDHPRIIFRGLVDQLEAELLLAAKYAETGFKQPLLEILEMVRQIIRCDVLEEPATAERLCGLTMDEIRLHSHFPQKYYDQPHFMPSAEDSLLLLLINKARTIVRRTELAAYDAFHDREGVVTRPDIIQMLNRLSSMLWILMIRKKKEDCDADRS